MSVCDLTLALHLVQFVSFSSNTTDYHFWFIQVNYQARVTNSVDIFSCARIKTTTQMTQLLHSQDRFPSQCCCNFSIPYTEASLRQQAMGWSAGVCQLCVCVCVWSSALHTRVPAAPMHITCRAAAKEMCSSHSTGSQGLHPGHSNSSRTDTSCALTALEFGD